MQAKAILAAFGVLAVAGCGGGGQPSELNGMTRLQASTAARDVMDDETLEPESPAHGRTWLIDRTEADKLADGTWAWRVTFFSIGDNNRTLCLWLQLTDRSVVKENVEYFVDACPTASVD